MHVICTEAREHTQPTLPVFSSYHYRDKNHSSTTPQGPASQRHRSTAILTVCFSAHTVGIVAAFHLGKPAVPR